MEEFEDDPDLTLHDNEPEAWSVTVDKKTVTKMTGNDIKRQDHIWGSSSAGITNFVVEYQD